MQLRGNIPQRVLTCLYVAAKFDDRFILYDRFRRQSVVLNDGAVNAHIGSDDLFQTRRGLGLTASDKHDLRSRGGKTLGHRAAQFAGAANYYGHLAGQTEGGIEIFT